MKFIEMAPDTLVRQIRYSRPPKLETISEEDNVDFIHVTKRHIFLLPILLFVAVGSLMMLRA